MQPLAVAVFQAIMAESEDQPRPKTLRERRLAEALRANLKRRKDQQRNTKTAPPAPEAQNRPDR